MQTTQKKSLPSETFESRMHGRWVFFKDTRFAFQAHCVRYTALGVLTNIRSHILTITNVKSFLCPLLLLPIFDNHLSNTSPHKLTSSEYHVNGRAFCVCIISFSIMLLIFIYVFACISSLVPFIGD